MKLMCCLVYSCFKEMALGKSMSLVVNKNKNVMNRQ
jgi:hypothetical protein